jgi:serine phosphatase RsbU (regulator of sigma subunit)
MAGHPAPFVLTPAPQLVAEHTRGPLLGIVRDPRWPALTVDLPEEWSLMLYTDGLIEGLLTRGEAAGSRQRIGEHGVLGILERAIASGMVGGELVNATIAEVEEHNGGPLTDDVAVCLVEGCWR